MRARIFLQSLPLVNKNCPQPLRTEEPERLACKGTSIQKKSSILSRSLLAAVLCALLLPPLAHASGGPRAKTAQGKVEGKLSADGQVREFLGIPFATPPVGPLRWRPPQPAAKWHGARDATAFGNRCVQSGAYNDMVFRDAGQSEDCLTLNVWTAARKGHGKLPVMVWIYGGGFTSGGTSEARQDGENLAHKGVVVVSMNYRLGIFGFYASHELAAESPQHAAGDYGLMDQTAALQWVRRNIKAFGGDPGNVTIFGESAGSISVNLQMTSPLSQGLFVHAIGESGGVFMHGAYAIGPLEASETRDEAFAQTAFGNSTLAAMRAVSTDALAGAALSHRSRDLCFCPNVDGLFLPESVSAIYAEGKESHVPLLAGWNKDEASSRILSLPTPMTIDGLHASAEKLFGPQAEEFLKAYAAANDEEAVRVAEDYAGDEFIAYSTWAWLEGQVKTGGAPVYRYYFELGSPGDPYHSAAMGAFHSDDIQYVFGTLDSRKGASWRPEDYKLSQLMQTYWTNFAKTGNPNSPGLPQWPTYDAGGNWQVMHLGAAPAAEPDQHRDRYLFLQSAWSQ